MYGIFRYSVSVCLSTGSADCLQTCSCKKKQYGPAAVFYAVLFLWRRKQDMDHARNNRCELSGLYWHGTLSFKAQTVFDNCTVVRSWTACILQIYRLSDRDDQSYSQYINFSVAYHHASRYQFLYLSDNQLRCGCISGKNSTFLSAD